MKKKNSKKTKNKSFKKMKKKALKMLDWRVLVILLIIIVVGIFFMKYSGVSEKDIVLNDASVNGNNFDLGSVVIPTLSFTFKEISLSDAIGLYNKNRNNSKFQIIDVSSDYNNGHIVNAVNYPIDSFEISIVGLDKTDIYLVYSRNEESRIAAKIMADNGFENVYRLQGNYGAWVQAGFPVAH